jgi:hydrogenase maturation protein HypF
MSGLSGEPAAVRCVTITVRGVVQGVGFRPFVYRAARLRGLAGWVQNEADTVRIEVTGSAAAVREFLAALRDEAPRQARIDAVEVSEQAVPASPPLPPGEGRGEGELEDDRARSQTAAALTPGYPLAGASPDHASHGARRGEPKAFHIRTSAGGASPQPTIPADLGTCEQCLTEIRDPAQRRFAYPFTNCTACGPRWSIIRQLPYDRPRTSMAGFAMCPACQAEYDDPADRRFHAQPIACPVCGPALELLDAAGQLLAAGQGAFGRAVEALLAGRIVALKGLGGFQLLVDATQAEAVARLRRRKHRPDRPLAVMFPGLDAVRDCCEVSPEEASALAGPEAPILLLRRRESAGQAPPLNGVAPGNPYLGAMLPYTPLHHLLLAAVGRPLVCTSGNLSEEPMATRTREAVSRLGPIADVLLTHNRPIVRPVDDSVARVGPEGLQVLRRARGYAPLPILLDLAAPTILAVGGHLKNTVALAIGRPHAPTPVVLSQHVGDLDSVLGVEVFRRAIDDLLQFFEAAPEAVACDLHPDYASTRHAETLAATWDVPLVRVQHHHAHVAAAMAEHGLAGPVLGLAWDGTGYGPDGTVWGGEALRCEAGSYRRLARLRTFPLPGGDRAVRQPRRSALGLLFEIMGDRAVDHVAAWFSDLAKPQAELETLLGMLKRRLRCPRTSSLGRLFDAIAALCGLPRVSSFEGQAAMALEFAAEPGVEEAYPLPMAASGEQGAGSRERGAGSGEEPLDAIRGLCPSALLEADWEPLVHAVLADLAAGDLVGRISARFHNALAEWAVAVARLAGCPQVALTGGCFQNALLTTVVRKRLLEEGFGVLLHRRVPPGDGGIALGQVCVAAQTSV